MKTPDPTLSQESFGRRHVIAWFAVLTILAGVAAYWTMLTGFYLYDDEGSLMITVKQSLAGMTIYEQVFSCYGPVYYFYQWALRTITATPVTHDVVRISALLPWLGTALICAWITLRLTRSLVLAAAAHLVTSMMLGFFQAEPGTSQELLALVLIALAAAPLAAGMETRRTVLMLALGALPAALFLIKINAGAFAMAAVAMSLVSCTPPTRVWRLLAVGVGTGCTALPLVLMRYHLSTEWARVYCWLAAASVAGCVCCMLRIRRGPLVTLRDCILAAGGFAVTTIAVLAILKAQGVSMAVLYESLIAAPSRIFREHGNWYRVPWLMKFTSLWALAGLGAALLTAWKQPLPGTRAWRTLFAGKAVFSVIALAAFFTDRPLMSVATPFVWLVLFDPKPGGASSAFPRRLLAILTVMQIMYAYPIAGSQFEFIHILLWISVVVCVGDSLFWLLESRAVPMPWWRTAATAALLVIALVHVKVGLDRYWTYRSLPSLDLPGARLLHVERETKANFQWLVATLKQQCDSFESLPGLPSLNFWTGIEPLTGYNIDAWTLSLSSEHQRRVVAAISSHPRACIVYNRALVDFWNPQGENIEDLPLVQYIFRNFQPGGSRGDYTLMLRNGRMDTAAAR